MRRLFIVVCLSGCGVLSGLDQLEITDGSAPDAPSGSDAPTDAGDSSAVEGGSDATPSAACDREGGVLCKCNMGTACCITGAGTSCSTTSTCADMGAITMTCTTSDQCNTGSVCCLTGVSLGAPACPVVLTRNVGTQASASCEPSCTGATGVKLCTSDLACGSGHCRLAAFQGTDASVGFCASF